ncbi:MAG: hypothetical protein ACLUNV_05705 [Sutterella wadsworthensis]
MLPSEVFLHLRLQFVRVLGLILTETRRGTASRSHLGVEEHVLEQAVRSLQTEGIESDAEFYRAFKAATGAGGDARSAEVHKAFVNAERSFSKNVSELRSKCNDKIRAELADQIPDVTGRRFNSYLVESNGQKDATAYGLQISPGKHRAAADPPRPVQTRRDGRRAPLARSLRTNSANLRNSPPSRPARTIGSWRRIRAASS